MTFTYAVIGRDRVRLFDSTVDADTLSGATAQVATSCEDLDLDVSRIEAVPQGAGRRNVTVWLAEGDSPVPGGAA